MVILAKFRWLKGPIHCSSACPNNRSVCSVLKAGLMDHYDAAFCSLLKYYRYLIFRSGVVAIPKYFIGVHHTTIIF